MSMEEMGDGRVMLGWQSKPGMGTTHVPGDGEYKAQGISRGGSTLECHQRFPARSKEQGPCSPKPACLESCGAQSLAGKGAARVMWASRHGDTGSLLGKELKVRLGSGFPEGETSPEAMNTVGSGAVFCKYRGILRNLKKTRQGQEFSGAEGICREQGLGSELSLLLRGCQRAALGSSPGPPEGAASGAEKSCQELGRGWCCAHHPAEVRGNPHRWRIQAWDSG